MFEFFHVFVFSISGKILGKKIFTKRLELCRMSVCAGTCFSHANTIFPLYGSLDQAPFDFCLPQNESEGDHHGDTSAAKDGALIALSK